MVALSLIATQLAQEGRLLLGLHPFGDDPEAKAVGQPDYGGGDRRVVGVPRDVPDEGLVDL